MGGWSVSGLCLSAIFPTCALMHGVWAAYAVAGRYAPGRPRPPDRLALRSRRDLLPAVVRGLYRDSLRDWNDGPDEVATDIPAPANATSSNEIL